MAAFEPGTSAVGTDPSAIFATLTALSFLNNVDLSRPLFCLTSFFSYPILNINWKSLDVVFRIWTLATEWLAQTDPWAVEAALIIVCGQRPKDLVITWVVVLVLDTYLLLGCTSGLNLAADLGPALASSLVWRTISNRTECRRRRVVFFLATHFLLFLKLSFIFQF